MERRREAALVLEDIVNLPETRTIPAGTWVIATEVLGTPGYWDVKTSSGEEICFVNQKFLKIYEKGV